MLELVKTSATLHLVGDRLFNLINEEKLLPFFIMDYWALMELLFGFLLK